MSKHIWGYWDCDCGRIHIRGDNSDCPGCGKPHQANTKFYVDTNNIDYVTKKEENDNPDWICSFCNSANSSKLEYCDRCGANKDYKEGDYFDFNSKKLNNDKENNEIVTNENNNFDKNSDYIENVRTKNKFLNFLYKNKASIGITVAITTIITAIIFLFIWLFTPIEHQMTIENFQWKRNIEIEELTTVNESGWSLPYEARLQYSQQEIHHYEEVIDHYEQKSKQVPYQSVVGYDENVSYRDLGNGQFEEVITKTPKYDTFYENEYYSSAVYRKEPQYATKYYYEIDKWVHSYNVVTSEYNKSPYWGEYTLTNKTRKGKSFEQYSIIGYIDNKEKSFNLSYSEWNKLNIGDTITFTTYRFNNEILSLTF